MYERGCGGKVDKNWYLIEFKRWEKGRYQRWWPRISKFEKGDPILYCFGPKKALRVHLVQYPHFTIKETEGAKGQMTCPTSGNSTSWNSQSSWLLGRGSSHEAMPVISQSEIPMCLTQKELLFFPPKLLTYFRAVSW